MTRDVARALDELGADIFGDLDFEYLPMHVDPYMKKRRRDHPDAVSPSLRLGSVLLAGDRTNDDKPT